MKTSVPLPRTRFSALRVLSAAAVMLFVYAGVSNAQAPPSGLNAPVTANLNITPKRLTFKKGDRSATVYIYNQGSVPATFDISLVDRVMLPSGEIVPVNQITTRPELSMSLAHLRSAKPFLVATPRRAMLLPGRGQLIRVRLGAPPSAEYPEYRSHLTVTSVPPRSVGLTAEQAAEAQQPERLSFQITSLFGISIPVIVRTSVPQVAAAIIQPELRYQDLAVDGSAVAKRTPVLIFKVRRAGANSLFGNVEIRSVASRSVVGLARGVGVYPEIDERALSIPLQRGVARGDTLEITFVDDDVNPGRVIARTTFVAP